MADDDYAPRWPALRVRRIDTGDELRVNPRDGDIYRLEKLTGTSVQRLEWTWSTLMPLAWFALRRQKAEWVADDIDVFVDQVDVDLWPDAPAEPGDQGKASDLDPPTGSSLPSP